MLNVMPVALTGADVEKKREEIRSYFLQTSALYETIFALLKEDEVFYQKSEPTRHPMIFYFGHTATFFINKLILAKVLTARINPEYESIFAIGVDEMGWDDMETAHYQWPDVSEVRAYRDQVKALVCELIDTLPLTLPITQESPFWVILMGIEHERIHIETSSVLHRQMPLASITSVKVLQPCTQDTPAPENLLVSMKGGMITLGKEPDHPLYGWDNEYGRKQERVAPFEVSKYLVSHAEYLPFVEEGGYETLSYWDEEGRQFLQHGKAKYPTFWIPDGDGGFDLRVLDRTIPLPLSWPVEVNALEAMAFCRWKSEKEGSSYGLMSEAQWYHLYHDAQIRDVPEFDDSQANINFAQFASPCPVDQFGFGALYDVVGNVWQWTRTPMDGFDGFEPHPIYDDFSTPTFDGKHTLLKGGSFASSGNALMQHSRYAFRRHFYQHAGFRYIRTDAPQTSEKPQAHTPPESLYQGDTLVNQYCDFHYGESYFGVENFAQKIAMLAIHYTQETEQRDALELGCAVGRGAFELANVFEQVTAIDFSARFIQIATQMQQQGAVTFQQTMEGEITETITQKIEDFSFVHVRDRVTFWQGDACNLKAHFTGYDLVLATNLIDRLYDPVLFLNDMHHRIREKGILILTSPYTWQESATEKRLWLGGYVGENGNAVYTLDGLKEILSSHFELIDTQDIPFVLRETARKFQHTLSQMSVWKKRG